MSSKKFLIWKAFIGWNMKEFGEFYWLTMVNRYIDYDGAANIAVDISQIFHEDILKHRTIFSEQSYCDHPFWIDVVDNWVSVLTNAGSVDDYFVVHWE